MYSRLVRQNSQPPQPTGGYRQTASPFFRWVTSLPASSTTPAPSAPRMCGNSTFIPVNPLRFHRSMWFREAARRRTTTSRGERGAGSSVSS